jgi:hypothetical protein
LSKIVGALIYAFLFKNIGSELNRKLRCIGSRIVFVPEWVKII